MLNTTTSMEMAVGKPFCQKRIQKRNKHHQQPVMTGPLYGLYLIVTNKGHFIIGIRKKMLGNQIGTDET